MWIYGFDPGITTGVCCVYVPSADDGRENPELISRHQVSGGSIGLARWLNHENSVWPSPDNRFVVEGFRLRRGTAMTEDQIAPTYGIGVVQGYAVAHDIPLAVQQPSERSVVTDEVLDNLFPGIDLSYASRHSKDALKHVIRYLVDDRHMPTLRKGWPDD